MMSGLKLENCYYYYHKMQETRNNCFGLKICSTALRQAKTDKHEFRNITATYLYFGTSAAYFLPETIVANFLHFMLLFFKVLLNHSSKHQFLVFHCRMNASVCAPVFEG